ncbi:hypothetical protein H5410_030861, partial [Solanum commersonii]
MSQKQSRGTIEKAPSHPILFVNSITIAAEIEGSTFHTLEIIQAVRVSKKAEPDDSKFSSATKMVASKMLKYGYHQKSELEPKGTNKLRYEPTLGRVHHGSSKTIFVPEQALIPDQTDIDDIVERIGNLFVAM